MEVKAGYKQTEVGVVPEDWWVKPLGKLGQFKNGINKGKGDFGHGFPFINLMDVFGIPKVSVSTTALGLVNSTPAERKVYDLKSGDVLFVRSSVKPDGVGLTSLIPGDLPETVFSGFLIRFRDTGLLDWAFKEHCFWNEGFRRRLISNSTVSANTNINQDALKRLRIAFPPSLNEQRAIAEALSHADALLDGLDRLIAKKRDLKQAAMQQLLTGRTRLPGFDDEWEVKRIGNIAPLQRGFDLPNSELRPGPYPVVYSNGVLNHHAYFQAPGPGVITGRSGTIGKVTFVEGSYWPHNTALWVTSFKNNDPRFIFYLYTRIGFERFAAGSGVPTLNRNDVHSFEVTIPPTAEEQTAISTVLSDMDAEIAVLEARRGKTHNLKQAMMQELLTGKTRVVPVGVARA
jgi:type I restriction enzyme S subunit